MSLYICSAPPPIAVHHTLAPHKHTCILGRLLALFSLSFVVFLEPYSSLCCCLYSAGVLSYSHKDALCLPAPFLSSDVTPWLSFKPCLMPLSDQYTPIGVTDADDIVDISFKYRSIVTSFERNASATLLLHCFW